MELQPSGKVMMKMTTRVNAEEIWQRRQRGESFCLVDITLPEDFALRHLPGAGNACVYEMVFIDRVTELVGDRSRPVVLYGNSARSRAVGVAIEKLQRAGYTQVAELEGGLEAWLEAGLPLEGGGEVPALLIPPENGTYMLEADGSRIEWSGRNLNNRHHGTLRLASGGVSIKGGAIVAGQFVIDMGSIENRDLADEGYRSMLLRHLASDDFFDVARHPTALFEISQVRLLSVAPSGVHNLLVSGELELKGVRRPLTFTAELAGEPDGRIKAHACLDLDRTLWGVIYGSDRYFERLGMHLVSDLISVELFLSARPA